MTYIAGAHKFICDVCGFEYLSTEKRRRWDGLIVCPEDYEQDHPQKYLRVQSDGQSVPDPHAEPYTIRASVVVTDQQITDAIEEMSIIMGRHKHYPPVAVYFDIEPTAREGVSKELN